MRALGHSRFVQAHQAVSRADPDIVLVILIER
jgi:hypothetical protein